MKYIIFELRYYITRIILRVQGLTINKKYNIIRNVWECSEHVYFAFLDSQFKELGAIPLSDRTIRKLSDIHDSPKLSKAQLRLASKKNGRPNRSKFYRQTAGTTGEPIYIWLDKEELSRMLGVREYCFRHYGIRVGDREARLWGRPEPGIKNVIKNLVLNRRVFHPMGSHCRDEIEELVKWKPTYIYGYSSLIIEAANIIKYNNIYIENVKCVICTAEAILPSQKKFISEVFGCPVAEEYGSTEFDVVAFECVDKHLHLVNPWLIVENIENEVVVSDVSRRSQSIIRYELGDSVVLKKVDCGFLGGKNAIEVIKGRATNQFAYTKDQEAFHGVEFSHAVDHYLNETGDSFRFSIVQYNFDAFYLDTNPSPSAGMDHLCRYIERYVFKTTGFNIVIKIDLSGVIKNPGNKQAYFVQFIDD